MGTASDGETLSTTSFVVVTSLTFLLSCGPSKATPAFEEASTSGEGGEGAEGGTEATGTTGTEPEPVVILEAEGAPRCGRTPYRVEGLSTGVMAFGDFDGDDIIEIVERVDADPDSSTVDEITISRMLVPVDEALSGYTAVSEWTIDRRASALTTIDHDGDGIVDLLREDGDSERLYFERGNGDLTFGPDIEFTMEGTTHLAHLNTRDADGDGRSDVTVSEGEYDEASVAVHLAGGGEGHLSPLLAPLEQCFLTASDWGDVDGDGQQELVVVDGCNGDVSTNLQIFELDSGGLVKDSVIDIGETFGPTFLRAAHLNADDHVDLVFSLARLAGDDDATLAIVWGGETGLDPSVQEIETPELLSEGFVLQVDSGPADMVFEHLARVGDDLENRVAMMLNDGDGRFEICPLPGAETLLAVGDVDGDRVDDVLTRRYEEGPEGYERIYLLWRSG